LADAIKRDGGCPQGPGAPGCGDPALGPGAPRDRGPKIHIIGIGDDGIEGLTGRARQILAEADVILGSDRLLRSADPFRGEKIELPNDLETAVGRLAVLGDRRAVLIAYGDPMFYGTARYVCDRIGADRFEVVPHVSSMQLAFARIKESWDDAYLANLATQDIERVIERIRVADKVGLFTSEAIDPSRLAEILLASRVDFFRAYVCENLGSPDERVTQCDVGELVGQHFAPLNVLILVRKPRDPGHPASRAAHRLFGNPDELFLQALPKRGLLTPSEVRAIALAQLDLTPRSIVWDVGAGSGSVAIEAARIAERGMVYAIEMDPSDHQLICGNMERFGVANVRPILGEAPDAWRDLPDPDAVFVGGSGRQVDRMVELAFERLRPGGRLMGTVSTIENLAAVRESLERLAGEVSVWMIQIARGNYQMDRMAFTSLNPVFLIGAGKRAAG